jgi:Lactonase, 7-bladed beta-propeller
MDRHFPRAISKFLLLGAFLALAACGGGGSSGMPHTIGGTITGLSGSGLVLVDNGGNALPVTAQSTTFTFSSPVPDGNSFAVTVSTQPTTPWQTCSVAHGSGTVSGTDVTNVSVTCVTNTYTIGGMVSGLTGSGLVLTNNGGNDLPIASTGSYTFSNPVPSMSGYSVAVATQPANPPQTCVVSNESGNVGGSAITNVDVACTTNTYTAWVYIAGVVGSGLTLSFNGGAAQPVSHNGPVSVATHLMIGGGYDVAIVSQPVNQTCTLRNGSGTVGTVDVTSISVFCPQSVGTRAYVVSAGDSNSAPVVLGSISVYTINPASGGLAVVPGSTVTTGPNPLSFQLIPHAQFAWALNNGDITSTNTNYYDSSIYDYAVDPNTGLLSAVSGSPFFELDGTANTPPGCQTNISGGLGHTTAVTFAPSGTFGYAANIDAMARYNRGLWTFTIDPTTGAPLGLGTSAPGVCPSPELGVTIGPSDEFAYIAGGSQVEGDPHTDLFAFSFDPATGALTSVGASIIGGAGAAPTIDPAGRFLYVIDGGALLGYTIDPASGAVTPVSGSPFTFPSSATSMAIEPHGRFAYVSGTGGIYTYSIDASTGALSPAAGVAPVPLTEVSGLQIDPSGQYAYAAASTGGMTAQRGVYAYAINANTGALTPTPGGPFALGSPYVITITN